MTSTSDDLADDLLVGADEIGAFLFGNEPDPTRRRNKIYNLTRAKRIPTFNLAGSSRLHARKSELATILSAEGRAR